MPLWKIYHPVDAYSAADKKEMAGRITRLYRLLPRFYVGVVFQEIAADSFYVGGEPTNRFVRIWVDHIARSLPVEARAWWLEKCNEALAPFTRDRGYDWEFHIDETPFDIWSIQGLRPPPPNSEAEKKWIAENKATAYTPPAPAAPT